MNPIGRGRGQSLPHAGWPANLDTRDIGGWTETEVQPPLVLRAETTTARHFLNLLLSIPEHPHLRADSASVALHTLEIELNPMAAGRDCVFVEQQWRPLICRDYIQHSAIAKVAEGDRSSIVPVGDSHQLGH